MKANVYDEGQAPDVHQFNEAGKSSQKASAPAKAKTAAWLVLGLLVLSAIPLAAGAFRLTQLAIGAEITPANARFLASPLPVVLHIVSAAVYAVLGAFQFAPGFRRRKPGWHSAAGRLLVVCGLLVGLSGLWMTLFYPWPDGDGELLYGFRLLFGSGMVIAIVLGFTTILRGDVRRHRAWMARAYAIGLGAGTPVLTLAAGELILGPPGELSRALLMGAAWVINLAVAEWSIRRRSVPPVRTASAVVSHLHCARAHELGLLYAQTSAIPSPSLQINTPDEHFRVYPTTPSSTYAACTSSKRHRQVCPAADSTGAW